MVRVKVGKEVGEGIIAGVAEGVDEEAGFRDDFVVREGRRD